jgi:glucosamine-6-phosphate deaminase
MNTRGGPAGPVAEFSVDRLRVRVFADREAAGEAAAAFVAAAVAERLRHAERANVVFAAAPSQDAFLDALLQERVDWPRLVGFHMDEYLGLPAEHPSSFRHYLNHRIFRPAGVHHDQLRLIPGESRDLASAVCLAYEQRLRAEPPDVVCAGIGENGHLAFNDPPVADFADPVWVKTVRLDAACRAQQVNDGCFARLEDVPTHAYTLTVPALLAAQVVSVVVPGPRKAEAVRATLRGRIDEACPATALRRHAGAVLFLDRESASLL